MKTRGHGQVRRSQLITTYGPGALIDLPEHSAIVAGLEHWPAERLLEEIQEPRLAKKLEMMTDVEGPRLFAPPAEEDQFSDRAKGITVWRFPEWFVVQEQNIGEAGASERTRRLVHRKALDEKGKFEGLRVVPTRFVRACPKGHVDDLDWHRFVHGEETGCRLQLQLEERGTSGDLNDLVVRCACGASRVLAQAAETDKYPLGTCPGRRPWLGLDTEESCTLPSRLLIRNASSAYFAQVLSVLSLPEKGSAVQEVVDRLWTHLEIVEEPHELAFAKKRSEVTSALEPFADDEVMAAIQQRRKGVTAERPVKEVELDAMLAAPEGFGDDVPVDHDFHARRLPDRVWRRSNVSDLIERVIQLHRLREVRALAGFSRLEAVTPDVQGEYETDVERAPLALVPAWFPAVENRGEGVFVQLSTSAVTQWLGQQAVRERVDHLAQGHERWRKGRSTKREFPGGPYVLLHTLSHLLLHSLAMRCGYPASSLRERIYSDPHRGHYGILIYTGSPDAEGTLGGLVQQARYLEDHLEHALRMGGLCSNDPICAQHRPGESLEARWLHGAACHGCALVAEPSCEMRNDYLDRGLVVPILGQPDAAFFPSAL